MSDEEKKNEALDNYRKYFLMEQKMMLDKLEAGISFMEAGQLSDVEREELKRQGEVFQVVVEFMDDEKFGKELMKIQQEVAGSEAGLRIQKHIERYCAEVKKATADLFPKSKKRSKNSLPALRLARTKKKSLSRLGGLPNLPNEQEWPLNSENNAMIFLGQIDCAELHKYPCDLKFPDKGMMFFFWDSEAFWEQEIPGKVLFAPVASDSERNPPAEQGDMFEIKKADYLTFKPFPNAKMDALEGAEYAVEQSFPCHQMFGHPVPIQDNDHREECVQRFGGEIDGWRLLLQLDEDEAMIWGDAGRAYFWIRTQDFAAGDFSCVVMVTDSC